MIAKSLLWGLLDPVPCFAIALALALVAYHIVELQLRVARLEKALREPHAEPAQPE